VGGEADAHGACWPQATLPLRARWHTGRRHRGEREAAPGEETEGEGRRRQGEERREGEALCGRETKKQKTSWTTMVEGLTGGDLAGAGKKSADWGRTVGRIDESKAPGEALEQTNAVVPLDSADDTRIESNCSPELLPKLEPP
jgi:hypothetical protein